MDSQSSHRPPAWQQTASLLWYQGYPHWRCPQRHFTAASWDHHLGDLSYFSKEDLPFTELSKYPEHILHTGMLAARAAFKILWNHCKLSSTKQLLFLVKSSEAATKITSLAVAATISWEPSNLGSGLGSNARKFLNTLQDFSIVSHLRNPLGRHEVGGICNRESCSGKHIYISLIFTVVGTTIFLFVVHLGDQLPQFLFDWENTHRWGGDSLEVLQDHQFSRQSQLPPEI